MYLPVATEILKNISIFSSGDHVCQPSMKSLINLGRGHHEEYFSKNILNLN